MLERDKSYEPNSTEVSPSKIIMKTITNSEIKTEVRTPKAEVLRKYGADRVAARIYWESVLTTFSYGLP